MGFEPNLSSCKEDAFPVKLSAHSRNWKESNPRLLSPRQALYPLSYNPIDFFDADIEDSNTRRHFIKQHCLSIDSGFSMLDIVVVINNTKRCFPTTVSYSPQPALAACISPLIILSQVMNKASPVIKCLVFESNELLWIFSPAHVLITESAYEAW